MLLDAGARLLGGLGLFLLGMGMMSDGLRLAAGAALRGILANYTRTRKRGLLAGVLVTAMVQSSSAVTVAVIGFVNAGLLTLERAVWVVFGSNVGTTATGWLVAVVGFKVQIEALALPLVGVGMILKLSGGGGRRAAWGLAVIGFGLLFLGIETLQQAFAAFGDDVALPAVVGGGPLTLAIYVVVGMVLTTLMQSSSAALVVALAAAQGGMVPLGAAAAVVIGANVGTTSTALISVWGATSAAKRVALAHVAFNVVTGLIALLLIQPLLASVNWLQVALDVNRSPAVALAVFHTVFNCLGVLLMWPLGGPLVSWVGKRFRRAEEDAARPRFLDRSVMAVPELALDALDRELSRVRGHGVGLIRSVFALAPAPSGAALSAELEVIHSLVGACREFIADVGRRALPQAITEALADRLRAAQHYADAADAVMRIHALGSTAVAPSEVATLSMQLERELLAVADMSEGGDVVMLGEAEGGVERAYQAMKARLLEAAARGLVDMRDMDRLLERARLERFAAQRLVKAARRMQFLGGRGEATDVADVPEEAAGVGG